MGPNQKRKSIHVHPTLSTLEQYFGAIGLTSHQRPPLTHRSEDSRKGCADLTILGFGADADESRFEPPTGDNRPHADVLLHLLFQVRLRALTVARLPMTCCAFNDPEPPTSTTQTTSLRGCSVFMLSVNSLVSQSSSVKFVLCSGLASRSKLKGNKADTNLSTPLRDLRGTDCGCHHQAPLSHKDSLLFSRRRSSSRFLLYSLPASLRALRSTVRIQQRCTKTGRCARLSVTLVCILSLFSWRLPCPATRQFVTLHVVTANPRQSLESLIWLHIGTKSGAGISSVSSPACSRDRAVQLCTWCLWVLLFISIARLPLGSIPMR